MMYMYIQNHRIVHTYVHTSMTYVHVDVVLTDRSM